MTNTINVVDLNKDVSRTEFFTFHSIIKSPFKRIVMDRFDPETIEGYLIEEDDIDCLIETLEEEKSNQVTNKAILKVSCKIFNLNQIKHNYLETFNPIFIFLKV
jgi:hypothetical protein